MRTLIYPRTVCGCGWSMKQFGGIPCGGPDGPFYCPACEHMLGIEEFTLIDDDYKFYLESE